MHSINHEALRLARQKRGIKPGPFADMVGVTRQWITEIESGRGLPSLELVFKMADELEIEPESIATWDVAA